MKQIAIFLPVFLFINTGILSFGQNPKIDSLLCQISYAKSDTIQMLLYNNIGQELQLINLDSSLYYFNQALNISTKYITSKDANGTQASRIKLIHAETLRLIGITYSEKGIYNTAKAYFEKSLSILENLDEKKQLAVCYLSLGNSYCGLGNYVLAREYYSMSLKINQEYRLKKNIAKCFSQIGNSYNYQGWYNNAIEYYLKSLKIREELKDEEGMSACYTNMGGVYYYQKEYTKAINLYSKSLKIDEKLGDKSGVSINYNNIGLAYTDLNQYDKAIDYFLKSIRICEELGQLDGIADGYNNIGLAYKGKGETEIAIDYYAKSLKIAEESNNKKAVVTAEVNIADLYIGLSQTEQSSDTKVKHLNLAIAFGKKAIKSAKVANLIQLENYASKSLLNAYKELGNINEAFKYAEVFIATNDSMFKKEKTDALAEMEAKYQNEKIQKEIEVLEKDKTISHIKDQKQKIIITSILIGLCLLIFMVTFILRRLQITRRQKRIIEEKNDLLIEQNEEISAQSEEITAQRNNLEVMNIEITSSITYASRIQYAILPPVEILDNALPENFIFFKPCEIVSGDFYWFKKIKNYIYIAAADCTGHGVPGAFMSMLGVSLLNEIVTKRDVNPPNIVLNDLRKSIKKALHQQSLIGEAQDGMDIAFCLLDLETNIVQFSGAYNPFYLIRNNELIEYKADRMPIGVHPNDTNLFTLNTIELQANDTFYIFSDGYVSQFGGKQGDKFKSKRFKDLLLKINPNSMNEQKEIMNQTFEEWRGEVFQVDDICIIGIRINKTH